MEREGAGSERFEPDLQRHDEGRSRLSSWDRRIQRAWENLGNVAEGEEFKRFRTRCVIEFTFNAERLRLGLPESTSYTEDVARQAAGRAQRRLARGLGPSLSPEEYSSLTLLIGARDRLDAKFSFEYEFGSDDGRIDMNKVEQAIEKLIPALIESGYLPQITPRGRRVDTSGAAD